MSLAVAGLVSWVGLGLSSLAMSYTVIAWLAVVRRRREVPPEPPTRLVQPPVTVLKPLCGADRSLDACLRSFCEQRYPRFQMIFGVQDADDPAIAVVRRLQREFPEKDLTLAVSSRQRGNNRKVSNLINMMPLARHEYLVIADSDVLVAPDYLDRVTAPLVDPGVGIVTCAYRGRPAPGVWSLLGSLFINDWFMPSAQVAAMFGSRSFAFGATIAMRAAVLSRIGGFQAVADQLADDYRLGELTRRLGLRTVLSEVVVDTCVEERSAGDLLRHELRWLRTIGAVRPIGYALSFVSFGVPVAALGSLLANATTGSIGILAITVAARLMLHTAASKPLPLTRAWALLLNDLLAFSLWCWAFTGRGVQWRNTRYKVLRDGSVRALASGSDDIFSAPSAGRADPASVRAHAAQDDVRTGRL